MTAAASLPYELVFLTTSNTVVVKDLDQACYRLHDKAGESVAGVVDPLLREARRALQDSKKLPWRLTGKLKDHLRELESLQEKERCLAVSWIAPRLLTMLFGNGALCIIQTDGIGPSVSRIFIDRSLCDRFTENRSERPVHAIIHGKTIAVSFYEPKVLVVRLLRSLSSLASSGGHRWRPLAGDARITALATVGIGGRRADRRLTWAPSRGWLVVFWNGAARDDALPWSPLLTDKQRANVLIYTMLQENNAIELFSYGRIERAIHAAELSHHVANNLITVEGPPAAEEDPNDSEADDDYRKHERSRPVPVHAAYVCVYQIGHGRFVRLSCVTISLDSALTGCGLYQALQRVLIATREQTVLCYDAVRRKSSTRRLGVAVDRISWHPDGAFALLASLQGKLLAVDMALNNLPLCAVSDVAAPHDLLDLNPFFRHKPSPLCIEWEPRSSVSQSNDHTTSGLGVLVIDRTCLVFINVQLSNGGPLCPEAGEPGWCGGWGPVQLCELYSRRGAMDAALSLLRALSWAEFAPLCYRMLIKCCNRLLTKPFDDHVEAQLECAMASFFCEGPCLEEGILAQFMPKVVNLARRFFFELMRHGRYEKAFLLAVDIESVDLFYDLCTIAKRLRLSGLVRASQRKIEELESSTCSSSFSSHCTSSSSDHSDASGSGSGSSSNDELDWIGREHQFIQLEPTQVKVAAATPTKQLTLGPSSGSSASGLISGTTSAGMNATGSLAQTVSGTNLPRALLLPQAPIAPTADSAVALAVSTTRRQLTGNSGKPTTGSPAVDRPDTEQRKAVVDKLSLSRYRERSSHTPSVPLQSSHGQNEEKIAALGEDKLFEVGPVSTRSPAWNRRSPTSVGDRPESTGLGGETDAEQVRQLTKGIECIYFGQL